MTQIKTYHRPQTLPDALSLLAQPGAAPLAGGLGLIPANADTHTVVDLQALGLDTIETANDRLTLGAMTRLQDLVDSDLVPAGLRQAAHRAGPNTFRNMATLGGILAAGDWETEFLAALLVFDTHVTLATPDQDHTLPLPDFLANRSAYLANALIIECSLAADGATAAAQVARTPADTPIVAAVARKTDDGALHLALSGVALTPILVAPDQLDALTPPADFRGSADYRKTMAHTLAQRVIAEVGG